MYTRPLKKKGQDPWYSRGYLPHFDDGRRTQGLTFRLHDSLPRHLVATWREAVALTAPTRAAALRRRRHEALDRGHGACYLAVPAVADLARHAFEHFHGERYLLHAWVVMPNHCHVLVSPLQGTAMADIVASWKGYIARGANRLLARRGPFWARGTFDRYIRNNRHFDAAVAYIEHNPVQAGLCPSPEAWPWSSATQRPSPDTPTAPTT